MTFEEVYKSSLDYFCGDELAAKVFVDKYALKSNKGEYFESTPNEMHQRIAREIVRIEQKYPNPILTEKNILEVISDFNYLIPQGGNMFGIGNSYQLTSLSNCFVIGNRTDSYGGIMRTDEEQIQLMKRRGGVGHDLSHIRPRGSPVNNSAITSTGMVPFMERYSNSTREVAQEGRRGALMLSMSVEHPEIESFIDAKIEEGKVTGANISVKLTDEFMRAVESNRSFIQRFPIDSENPQIIKEIDAKDLWNKIIHNAWQSAEPGVLFWDTILRESIPDCYIDSGFGTVSTNPCGEIPLCPYDSCRLLAINLYSYVKQPFKKEAEFDFDLFEEHAALAQRMMDNIVDLEVEKIDAILMKIISDYESDEIKHTEQLLWEKIRHKTLIGRRIGIGITAEGDMLAALGFRYGTEEATNFAERIQKVLALSVYRASVEVAKERGAFEIFNIELEKNNPFIHRLKEVDSQLIEDMQQFGRRNIACLTIAPTGTTSLMSQTTSGIEPVFLPVYKRRRKVNPSDEITKIDFVDEMGDSWVEYTVFHHKFVKWMEVQGYPTTRKYAQREIDALVAKSPYYKSTSNDVDWLQKVKMQGRIQRWVDHSISVTINLPNETKEELVNYLYIEAWKSGCKGCTVYRDGSRNGVLVTTSKENHKIDGGKEYGENLQEMKSGVNQSEKADFISPAINLYRVSFLAKRPSKLEADVVRFQNNKEKWIAFIGLLNNFPYEIFTGLNDEENGIFLPKSVSRGVIIKNVDENGDKRYDFQYSNKHGCKTTIEGLSAKFNPEYWNYAKLISGVLRYAMPLEQVIDLVHSLHLNDRSINTWKSGVERALKKYIKTGTKLKGEKCSNCGQESLVYQEGCISCASCGYSKCE